MKLKFEKPNRPAVPEKPITNMTGYERYLKFNKDYDGMGQTYKLVAKWYKENRKNLPSGVFASENSLIVTPYLQKLDFMPKAYGERGFSGRDIAFHDYITGVPMFSAWRNTLSIYKVDEMIFDEMLKTPLPPDTPSDIFRHLPDFCVYVEFPHAINYSDLEELPPHPINGKSSTEVAGFWAYPIEKNHTLSNRIELNICPNVVNTGYPLLLANSIVLEKGLTIEQAFEKTFSSYDDVPTKQGSIEFDRVLISRFLSILLWLCVDEPDVTNITGEPVKLDTIRQYNVHKKTGDFVPPSQPRIFNIGKRLGGEIRQYKERIAHDIAINKTATKRPHIRRGHWHGYWYGTGQNKEFKPKWLSATFVNAE